MGWDEVKDEKEGYVRVRKANDRGFVGRLKKENDDPEAKGYIELNKEDLGGMGGGGNAPHSHSEYSVKSHGHDDKADKDHTHDLTHTHDGFATTAHTHPPQDLTHDHDDEYANKTTTNQILNSMATDISSLETKTYNNQEAIKTKADADHTHDGGDGTRFDPTYLEEKDAEEDARIGALEESQEEQNARLDALEAGEAGEGAVVAVGTWKRNDRADTSGGMIGVANFNNVSSIMLSRNDITHQAFDFSEIEVGNVLTITNTNNTDAKGKYTVTSLENKGAYWKFGVDTIEGTGIASMNDFLEFSFAAAGAGAGGEEFDPTYLEEKDSEQDGRLDAVEKDIEEHNEEFEELKNQVDEHLANHSAGGGNENVSQWTTKAGVKKEDSGFVEFLIASGERQSVLIPTLDADGNPSPVFEVGDIMTIKSDGHKNTFEVKSIAATAGGCVSYLSDYYGEGQFASTPDKEATIMLGEEETADHEHEDLDDRISALEKEHGPKGPKKQFVTSTGPVNNSDGLIDLKPSLKDSSWQWVLISAKDINGETFINPKVGEPFTVEWGGKTITGEVTFSQGSDIWMITSDGVVTTSKTNGDPAIVYVGPPREDEPVGEHDHDKYVEKTEFEELEKKLDDHLNFEPGETFVYETTNYVNDWDNGKVSFHNWQQQQEVNVNTINGDGDPIPILEVGDEMTIIFEDQKHTFTVTVAEQASKTMRYLGPEGDTEAISCLAESDRGKEVTLIFGEEPLPVGKHEHEGMVVSDSVTSIVRLSQSEYDALVDKDASTLYLVV